MNNRFKYDFYYSTQSKFKIDYKSHTNPEIIFLKIKNDPLISVWN